MILYQNTNIKQFLVEIAQILDLDISECSLEDIKLKIIELSSVNRKYNDY